MCREYESLQMVLLGDEKPDADSTVHHRSSLLFAATAVHRDSPSWPDLRETQTGHGSTAPRATRQNPAARKGRLLIFALQWISQQRFALWENLWERVNLSGFKSQASMELLRVLSKQAVLGYFMGAHQPRRSFWRKISAEIAVFVRLLAVKVL